MYVTGGQGNRTENSSSYLISIYGKGESLPEAWM
jgi:hypothetical protein